MSFYKKINIFKFQEFALVLILMLFCGYYFKQEPLPINSDGKGYYDYLPAVFIYHDLTWKHLDTLNTTHYGEHSDYPGIYNNIKNKKINKYFIGTSIAISPFFFIAYTYDFLKGGTLNGYSNPYQDAVYFAALFYLWLGLLYLRKILIKIKIKTVSILITQILIVFATPIIYYSYYQPAFSHIYSFAIISMFLYYVNLFFTEKSRKSFLLVSLLLSLIILIRPVNGLVIFILPVFSKSFKEFIITSKEFLLNNRTFVFVVFIMFLGVLFLQPFFWYLQTGNYFINSYSEESFNFLTPEILNIFFSYKKGLFVYSPILLITLIGGIYVMIKRKEYYKVTILSGFVLLFTYVVSSWWSWWYSMSYGQRVFVDILGVLAIFSAYFFNSTRRWFKKGMLALGLLLCIINIIQIDQYSRYILHWDNMNKESYWKVFLKTDVKYQGILWDKPVLYEKYQVIKSVSITEPKKFDIGCWCEVLDIEKDSALKEFNLIHIKNNISKNKGTPFLYVIIEDSKGSQKKWLQEFLFKGIQQKYFYKEINIGEGNYFFEIPSFVDGDNIKIGYKVDDFESLALDSIKITFINH